MEYRWEKKKLNVQNVVAKAEHFLRNNEFTIKREDGESCVKLIGVRRKQKYDVGLVEIVVSWSQEGSSVRFDVNDHFRPILHFGSLFSFWGGGSLVLKELKVAEAYRKLEEEFWREIEETVSGSLAL